jgi:hypothetical protein
VKISTKSEISNFRVKLVYFVTSNTKIAVNFLLKPTNKGYWFPSNQISSEMTYCCNLYSTEDLGWSLTCSLKICIYTHLEQLLFYNFLKIWVRLAAPRPQILKNWPKIQNFTVFLRYFQKFWSKEDKLKLVNAFKKLYFNYRPLVDSFNRKSYLKFPLLTKKILMRKFHLSRRENWGYVEHWSKWNIPLFLHVLKLVSCKNRRMFRFAPCST